MDYFEEFSNFAVAIVEQAFTDYKYHLEWLKEHRNTPMSHSHEVALRYHIKEKIDCELFFRSGWASMLTDIDCVNVMKMIKRQVNDY